MESTESTATARPLWNKGELVGQKTPFKLKEIWAICVRLQLAGRRRELALFNLAIDSKLRACDLVKLRVREVCHGQTVASRMIVLQQKTQRPVQFEITEPTREAVGAWISFQADFMAQRTSPLGSTPGSWTHGSGSWDWTRPAMEHTPSGEQRRP